VKIENPYRQSLKPWLQRATRLNSTQLAIVELSWVGLCAVVTVLGKITKLNAFTADPVKSLHFAILV